MLCVCWQSTGTTTSNNPLVHFLLPRILVSGKTFLSYTTAAMVMAADIPEKVGNNTHRKLFQSIFT